MYLVRHAIAEDSAEFALIEKNDDLRPLTSAGRSKMRIGAKGMQRIVPEIDILVSSELVRAVETARILHKRYANAELARTSNLNPGNDLNITLRWLQGLSKYEKIMLVGHEPDLGELMAFLLTGTKSVNSVFKKGSLAVIHFPNGIKPGTATLRALLQPSHLRTIGA